MTLTEIQLLWSFGIYCLSAVGVMLALDRMHFNKHETWLQAFTRQPDWPILLGFIFIPVINTALALMMWLQRESFDRVNDDH